MKGRGQGLVVTGQERSLQARLMASEAAMAELQMLRERQQILVEEAKKKLPGNFHSSINKLRDAVDHLKRTDGDLVGTLQNLNTQILQLKLAGEGEDEFMSASCRSMSSSAVSIPSTTSSSRTNTLKDLPDSRRSSGFFDASSPSPPLTPDIASPEKLHHYGDMDGRVSVTDSLPYSRHSFGESVQPDSMDGMVSNDEKQSYFSGVMLQQNQTSTKEQDSLNRRFKMALRPKSKSGLSVCYPYPSPMHAIAMQSDMFVVADSESVVEDEDSCMGTTADNSHPTVRSTTQTVRSSRSISADDWFVKAPPCGRSAGLLRPVSTPPDISRVWNGSAPWSKKNCQKDEELIDSPDYENIFSATTADPVSEIAPPSTRHSYSGPSVVTERVEDATYENLPNIDNEYGDYVTLAPKDLPQTSHAARPEDGFQSRSTSKATPVSDASSCVSQLEPLQEKRAPRKPKPTPRQSLLKKASQAAVPSSQPATQLPTNSRDVTNVKDKPRETCTSRPTNQEPPTSKTAQPGPALLMATLIADGKVQGLTDARSVPSKKDKSQVKIDGKNSPRKEIQAKKSENSPRKEIQAKKSEKRIPSGVNAKNNQEKTKTENKDSPRRTSDSNNIKTVRMEFKAPAGATAKALPGSDKVENSHVRSMKTLVEPNNNRTESSQGTVASASLNAKPNAVKDGDRNSPCRKLHFQPEFGRMSPRTAEGRASPGDRVPRDMDISTKRCPAQGPPRRMSKDAPLPPSAIALVNRPRNKPQERRASQPESHFGLPVGKRGVAADLRTSLPNSKPGRGEVTHGHRYRQHGDRRQQSASHSSGCVKKLEAKEDPGRRYMRHDNHKDTRKASNDKRQRRHTTAVNSTAHPLPMGGLTGHRNSHSSTSLNGHPMSKYPPNFPHRAPQAFFRKAHGLKKAGQSRSTSRLYDYDTSVLGSSSEESSSSDSEIARSESESDSESSDEGGLVLAEAKWPAVVGTATRRRLSSQDSLSRLFPPCHLVTEL